MVVTNSKEKKGPHYYKTNLVEIKILHFNSSTNNFTQKKIKKGINEELPVKYKPNIL